MQIINPTPSSGQLFGASLGEGLGAGLQALAEGKMQQIHRKNREKALESTFGPELARTLSHLNPQEFGNALKYLGQQSAGQQQMGQSSYDQDQSNYLLGQSQQPQQQMQQPVAQQVRPQAQNVMAQQAPVLNRPTSQPQAQAAAQKQATMQQLAGQPATQMLGGGTAGIKVTPEMITQQGPQNIAKAGMVAPVKKAGPLTVQDLNKLKQHPTQPVAATTPNQENAQPTSITKAGSAQDNIVRAAPNAKTIKEAWNSTAGKYASEIHSKADSAERQNMRLDRMAELDARGDIMSPFWATAIQKVGLEDAKFLKSKDTQEMEKLTAEFIKEAKPYFGSKVTNDEIKFYLKTIPTLYMTPEGRAAVSRDIKIINNAMMKEREVVDRIIEQNGNVPPYNLHSIVRKEMEPYISEVKKIFTGAGEGSSKYETGKIYKNKSGSRAKWDGSKMVPVEG